jgi:hypothetical protein
MEDIVLKYNLLDTSAKQALLEFLDFLVQKQRTKKTYPQQEGRDDLLVVMDKMGAYAQKKGLTQEILDEILNEE